MQSRITLLLLLLLGASFGLLTTVPAGQALAFSGDVQHDGRVGPEDVIAALQVQDGNAGELGVTAAADVDGDGRIGLAEAVFGLQNLGAGVRRPFPAHLDYGAGTIRPTNHTRQEQDDHVRALYDHWKADFLVGAGTDSQGHALYRVATGIGSAATVSEGQGFGMLITVLMAGHDPDARTLFDGLWYYARAFPSGIDPRLMTWKIQDNTVVEGNDSAFDGDSDIGLALLLADAQWGSDTGPVDYLHEARNLIQAIEESTIGPESRLPLLGDWVDPAGSVYNQFGFRSSDFMPAHFRCFARASGDPGWNQVIAATAAAIQTIQEEHSPLTGLLPDFIVQCQAGACLPASPYFLEGPHDGHYYYNAGRDPWRIGMDALLNGDPVSRMIVRRMIDWLVAATGGDPANIKAGYKLDGTPISNYFTAFFLAPFGVAAMTAPDYQQFLNGLYDRVYASREGYYEDSVNLLAMLVMTGNFWLP